MSEKISTVWAGCCPTCGAVLAGVAATEWISQSDLAERIGQMVLSGLLPEKRTGPVTMQSCEHVPALRAALAATETGG